MRNFPSLPCFSIVTTTGASGRTVPDTGSERPAFTRVVRARATSTGVQPTCTPSVAAALEPVIAARARTRPAARHANVADHEPSSPEVARATVTQPLRPCFWTSTRWPAIALPSARRSVPRSVSWSP